MVYEYTWDYSAKTANEIQESTLGEVPVSIDDIVSRVKDEAYNKTLQGLAEKALEQGLTLSIKSVNIDGGYTTRIETRTVARGETREIKYYRVWYSIHAVFESNQILTGSPIAGTLAFLLNWIANIIVTVVIAYFAIQAIKSWLTSMTTTESTITTIEYDEEGNVIRRTTEKITQPALAGTVGIIIVVAIVFLFLFFFRGMPPRRRR